MLPDRRENARRKEGDEGSPDRVPAAVALAGCGLLYERYEPTAILAFQVPRTTSPLPDDAREILTLPLGEGLVQAVTRVLPEGPSDFPKDGPRNCSPS
jgi:hypothetical protein